MHVQVCVGVYACRNGIFYGLCKIKIEKTLASRKLFMILFCHLKKK